jgi:hypothetical protein
MTASQPSPVPLDGRDTAVDTLTGSIGWVLLAGLVMIPAGMLNMIQGVIAVFDGSHYLAIQDGLVVGIDHPAWGASLLAFGAMLAVTGYWVLAGYPWARVVAVVLAVLDGVLACAFVVTDSIWCILAISLDLIVTFALTVYRREAREERRRLPVAGPR